MRIIPFVILILAGCGSIVIPDNDCNFIQNNYGQRVSWHRRLPIILYIHETFPKKYLPTLQAAVDKWNIATNRKMLVLIGMANGDNVPKQDGVSIIYWLTDWEANKSNEQARTTVYWDGDLIKEADIRVNGKNFRYSAPGLGTSMVDLESLIVHELGHVLGLKHNEAQGSVMAPALGSGVIRRNPNQADLSSLECEYQ